MTQFTIPPGSVRGTSIRSTAPQNSAAQGAVPNTTAATATTAAADARRPAEGRLSWPGDQHPLAPQNTALQNAFREINTQRAAIAEFAESSNPADFQNHIVDLIHNVSTQDQAATTALRKHHQQQEKLAKSEADL